MSARLRITQLCWDTIHFAEWVRVEVLLRQRFCLKPATSVFKVLQATHVRPMRIGFIRKHRRITPALACWCKCNMLTSKPQSTRFAEAKAKTQFQTRLSTRSKETVRRRQCGGFSSAVRYVHHLVGVHSDSLPANRCARCKCAKRCCWHVVNLENLPPDQCAQCASCHC